MYGWPSTCHRFVCCVSTGRVLHCDALAARNGIEISQPTVMNHFQHGFHTWEGSGVHHSSAGSYHPSVEVSQLPHTLRKGMPILLLACAPGAIIIHGKKALLHEGAQTIEKSSAGLNADRQDSMAYTCYCIMLYICLIITGVKVRVT